MGLLEVPAAASEGRDYGGGNAGFQQRLRTPLAVPHVHQIDRHGIVIVVEKVRSGDPAEPVEAIWVASPYEGTVRNVGKSGNAALQTVHRAGFVHQLPEPT